MTEIANLTVTVAADISDMQRGLNNASSQIDSFGTGAESSLASLGASITGAGAKFTAMTAPIAIAGAAGIKLASDFQTTMTEISARTGLAGDSLEEMRAFALQMGADTAFSGQQAADALLQLLTSGQSAEQAMQTLPAILDAAAASGEDLGTTADTITDIMAAFGIGVEYSADVVDSLARAAGASSADMASLGQGFGNVGGVASNFGLSMNRTAAILSIFAENGIKGAEAGTNLKSMLLAMSNDTDATVNAWAELGTSLYDTEGNMRDFETVISELDAVLDTLPVEEQNRYMRDLAGSYGIAGLTALRGSISISDMEAAMLGSAGASEVADARMDTFAGRVDSLKGSVETMMIQAMTPFMEDVLTPLAEDLTTVVNGVTDWIEENPELTNTIVAIGAALLVVGPAMIGIGTAMTLAAPAVGALAVAFGLLVSPIGLAVAAVAALGVAYTQNLGGIKDFVDNTVLPALNNLNLEGFATALQTGISDAVTGLTTGEIDLTILTTDVGASFTNLDFSGISETMDAHFTTIMDGIVSVAGIVFGGPIGMAIGAANLVSSAIESDFLGIGTFLESSGISGAVEAAVTDVKTTIDNLISNIFGGGAASGGTAAMDDMATSMGSGLSGPMATFISDIQLGFSALQQLAEDVWSNIEPGFNAIKEGITGFISAFDDTETDGLLRVLTGIVGFIGGIVGAAASIGSEVFGQVLTSIGAALPMVGEAISDLITAISRVGEGDVGGALESLGDWVTDLVNAAGDFLGIEIDIPDFSIALEGWRQFFSDLGLIIDASVLAIQMKVDEIATSIRGFVRDIQDTITDLQITATQAQIGLGINVEANTAFLQELQLSSDTSDIARKLEADINASLATGEPIQIDTSQLQYITSGAADATFGTDVTQALADKIADPTAIQDAIASAVGSGDTATAMAMIPLGLKLSDDPAAEMQELLAIALENGGPEGEMFQALIPLATELGIDTADMAMQVQTAMDAAITGQHFGVSPIVDINVIPGSVAFDANNLSGAIAGSVGAGVAVGAGGAVPMFAEGGMTQSEGLAYLHANERVLNPAETAAYNAGQATTNNSGGNNITINGAQDVDALLFELKRRGINLGVN